MRRETVEALINHLEERDMPPVRYRLWRAVKDEIEEDRSERIMPDDERDASGSLAREREEGSDRALFRRCLDLADAGGGDPGFATQTAQLLYALILQRGQQADHRPFVCGVVGRLVQAKAE